MIVSRLFFLFASPPDFDLPLLDFFDFSGFFGETTAAAPLAADTRFSCLLSNRSCCPWELRVPSDRFSTFFEVLFEVLFEVFEAKAGLITLALPVALVRVLVVGIGE